MFTMLLIKSMKHATILLFAVLFAGCSRNEGLDLKFKAIYTSEPAIEKSSSLKSGTGQTAATGDYTQFGDFLGSITPAKVTAAFNTIRFVDRKDSEPGMPTMLEIIGVNWPFDDPRRFADFTNGNTLEVVPEIYGNVDTDGWFVDNDIRMKYLFILPQEFVLEIDLPENISESNFGSYQGVYFDKQGNKLKCGIEFLLYHVVNEGYDIKNGIYLRGFVFGETETSYIVRQNNIPTGDVAELITQAQPHSVVRSSRYVSPVLYPPDKGETKIITTTISFDSEDIIQHYAGADNTPNTWDDILVFVPNFWERFSVVVEQN